ncbi:MAG: hypothetical protein M2R45_01014 [Verrucomicrobia subdivision 3 bacterium]|nr:hypothetical protein [Limisphaerales bacterium]MCS1414126.1 hypothetical protein [Limisphaerales bacterium]
MKKAINCKNGLVALLAFTLSTALIGCGGDETASESAEPITQEAAAPKASKKKTASKKAGQSTFDRINAALDRGNYMAAVDIAIKSGGKNASENMSNLRYVQKELGGPMANGDRKAHEAYKKLNAYYLMRYQR